MVQMENDFSHQPPELSTDIFQTIYTLSDTFYKHTNHPDALKSHTERYLFVSKEKFSWTARLLTVKQMQQILNN